MKEPQGRERARIKLNHIVFCYLHLAASGATCLAYETVTPADSSLPLLAGGLEVAGRMSV